MSLTPTVHVSVMLDEVLENIGQIEGGVFVDGTFGGGGYTRALLDRGAKKVIAIDQDPEAIKRAASWCKEYGERLVLVNDTFSNMGRIIKEQKEEYIDAIVLDLGFSSDQLDDTERGLSYKNDGPLDMRMGCASMSAADVVNTEKEEVLADIFYKYGEEKKSRYIAKRIVQMRAEKPFERTKELADLVKSIIPSWKAGAIHPAARVFQALRIYVNKEMEEIENVLPVAAELLGVHGRLAVVTFHSLEDAVVKRYFKEKAPKVATNKYARESVGANTEKSGEKVYKNLFPKALDVSAAEVQKNTRSRSAKLRVLERLA